MGIVQNVAHRELKRALCPTQMAEGRATFEAGPATVVGLARSSINGHATDAHQWLVNVTLLRE